MYNKNLPGRAGLTPEFEDGVKTFIEWANGQRRHTDGQKIRCPLPKDYFKAPSVPQVLEEPAPAGYVEGVPDDGTRSCSMDAVPSSNCYSGGPYNYDELGEYMIEYPNGLIEYCPPITLCREITTTRRNCMLYWKDDVDLEYCKFCEDARYKPSRGKAPHWKKSSYAILRTYDHATDRAYLMRAALMWIVNDLPTYRMTSGWSIAGVIGYPGCMDDTSAFHIQHDRKVCYFDCHRQFLRARPSDHKWTKKNIFCDLPYWSTLLIQHNFNIMHIEKNVFDNIFNTVMDIKGKTKDNMNAHRDLKIICNHPELELDERRPNVMPKVVYTVRNEQKRRSHDSHVFMQKLIPITFHEMLLEYVWSTLTEVSLLFQSICSTTLDVHKLHELENSVAIILCNLEKIFPLAFFDSMEHLIVHLPYEYFEPDVQSKRSMSRRNDECMSIKDGFQVSIFNYPGKVSGSMKKIWLSGPERHIIETYILTNCEVVTPYYDVEVTSVPTYFVNGYNFQTECQNTDKSTMNCGEDDPFTLAKQEVQVYFTEYPSMKRDKADWMAFCKIKARRVVDDSKWTETVAYQLEELVPVPIGTVDNQSYDLRDPNGLQVVLEAASTSRRQLHENDDENEDEDEDSGGDDETDDEEYEAT
ncbi:hypothetical protein Sango_2691600 [Sesamum angolense]|uniref:DUF4218 domain-containing protein n=1 Tax=Sesamum angolense TaxID=2727404 RepID=A0AAE1W2T1_9LAMI|nr:hypothetical protein Sango_2691600 [Sesamum angolense]